MLTVITWPMSVIISRFIPVSGLVAHDDSLRHGEFASRSFNKKPGACAPGLDQDCNVLYFCGFAVPGCWFLGDIGVISALVASL